MQIRIVLIHGTGIVSSFRLIEGTRWILIGSELAVDWDLEAILPLTSLSLLILGRFSHPHFLQAVPAVELGSKLLDSLLYLAQELLNEVQQVISSQHEMRVTLSIPFAVDLLFILLLIPDILF